MLRKAKYAVDLMSEPANHSLNVTKAWYAFLQAEYRSLALITSVFQRLRSRGDQLRRKQERERLRKPKLKLNRKHFGRLQRKKQKLRKRHDLQLKLSDNKKRQPGQRLRGRSNRKPSLK